MNISYNWLKDYVTFDLSPKQVTAALTSIGLESDHVEEVETIKGGLKGLVIGEVLTCEEHPDSDHLHVTTVDLGTGEPQQIVCGAPNVAAGQKVIVATPGTILYDGEESFTIKKSKIRGVESNGMICAEDEIGIGTSHDGIIVLPADAKIGTPAAEYYNVQSDYVLEVDITPNRVDATSHYGVARDLYAYLQQNTPQPPQGGVGTAKNSNIAESKSPLEGVGGVNKPSVESFKIDDPTPAISVSIENTLACPRYTGVTIKNITVKPSPAWLKNRLEAIGIRSINNVVDVTNYILHETGQPLHAFDVKAIKGGKVVVKTLPDGTPFVTLDGVERKLSEKDLMICNAENAMCMGGVFGGLESGMTESTTDVFLESAYFNPAFIRKTARFHGLNTDASFRFERGVDPNNTLYVLKRAALLIQEVAGGKVTGEIQDIYPHKIENPIVELSLQKITHLIGKQIPETTIENILKSLEIEILNKSVIAGLTALRAIARIDEVHPLQNDALWTLSIPTYRVDVTRDVDVIEDILRIYGYNNIEIGEEVKSTLSYQTPTDRSYELQNIISEQLTGAGCNEILNNSLTAGNYYEGLETFPKENCVLLRNPLSADLDVMRQTLLFGGLESIAYNRNRKNPDLKFYEFGNTYFHLPERAQENNYLSAIKEEFKLGLWFTGNSVSNNWSHPAEKTSVYELKAAVENILLRLGISAKNIVYKALNNDIFSSGVSIETVSNKKTGVLGVLQKAICKKFDIAAEVYFAELKWTELLQENANVKIKQHEISKFPSVRRDLALLLDKNVPFAEIEKIACQTDKKLLKEVTLFDVYEGKNLPESKKSYAVSFTLQDDEKTLNDKQIDNLMSRIQKSLEDKLGATLR